MTLASYCPHISQGFSGGLEPSLRRGTVYRRSTRSSTVAALFRGTNTALPTTGMCHLVDVILDRHSLTTQKFDSKGVVNLFTIRTVEISGKVTERRSKPFLGFWVTDHLLQPGHGA